MTNEVMGVIVGTICGIVMGTGIGILLSLRRAPVPSMPAPHIGTAVDPDKSRLQMALVRAWQAGWSKQQIFDACGFGYGYMPDIETQAGRLERELHDGEQWARAQLPKRA